MVGNADHELERSNDILLVVEGFDGLHVGAVLLDLAIDVGGVLRLNLGRVLQHCRAQVSRGRRAVDRPAEALAVKPREGARVVDVRVGQHHHIDVPRAKTKVPVAFDGLRAAALEKAAVEQDVRMLGTDDVP
jgi:hypothetical protein